MAEEGRKNSPKMEKKMVVLRMRKRKRKRKGTNMRTRTRMILRKKILQKMRTKKKFGMKSKIKNGLVEMKKTKTITLMRELKKV